MLPIDSSLIHNRELRFGYGAVLFVLFFAFCLRVLGQVLVMFFHVGFLPRAEAWFSGLMPYPKLLISQILIILLYGKICVDVFRGYGYFASSSGDGTDLLIFGSLYLGLMILRYILRMTLYPNERWTGGCIPIFFHWVLSSFLLVLGCYYYQGASASAHVDLTVRVVQGAALLGGVVCVLLWAGYQMAPSLLATRIGLGRSTFAVRPEKGVEVAGSDGPSVVVDVYHPQRATATPTLVIRITLIKGFKDSMLAGVVAKMWAERGYTVILQKAILLPEDREQGIEMRLWISSQSWFDGQIVDWEAASVRQLMDEGSPAGLQRGSAA
jgi:uncharacterized protein